MHQNITQRMSVLAPFSHVPALLPGTHSRLAKADRHFGSNEKLLKDFYWQQKTLLKQAVTESSNLRLVQIFENRSNHAHNILFGKIVNLSSKHNYLRTK
jgi:hypothetical protein